MNLPMLRPSVALSLLVLLLITAGPFLHKAQKHRTYRNFRVVEDGVLYRSGQMSPAGFERVCRERGVRTVIKLRDANDEKPADVAADMAEEGYCRANGIVFHRVLPKDWEVAADGGVPMEENLRWFERAMADPAQTPRPVLIHCFAGIHRTGAMVAVYRVKHNKYFPDDAIAELKACGRTTTTYVGNLIPFLRDDYLPKLWERTHGLPVGDPTGGR